MRVYITSTPDELEACRMAAVELVRDFGHEPTGRSPVPLRGLDPVESCQREVAMADAVLAIVGWRRGWVPSPGFGGDGLRPWVDWEVRGAFEQGAPVIALLASEGFSADREEEPEARAVIEDLRGELSRLGAVFDDEDQFRRLADTAISQIGQDFPVDVDALGLQLRRFSAPVKPPYPYPLLLPYSHPGLLAGRDEDLSDLRRVLAQPVTVVGLLAASGVGKSSLLAGGLVPSLQAEGHPVALDRHPAEPGLGARLIAELVETGDPVESLDDPRSFVDRLAALRRLAGGAPPVLVIDQIEDLLGDGTGAARATLGPLLAASAQRLPGLEGPPCRWLLACSQEYYGRLVEWLGDVLADARKAKHRGLEMLPHDLSKPSRFAEWLLRPLATPSPRADDPLAAATRVFLDVIEKPLTVQAVESAAGPPEAPYPWAFAPGHAGRLARAFAEARIRQPEAPLSPELQVVLAHLLDRAGEPTGPEPRIIEVPDDPSALIHRALEEHLCYALDLAFPPGLGKAARIERTRALLILRELAASHGRREQGRSVDFLKEILGEEGVSLLDNLSTPRTRIVLRESRGETWVYRITHDRLAEILVQITESGRWPGLGIDPELFDLRRFVMLQTRLFAAGDVEQATAVSARRFARIEANRDVLLWNEQHLAWWRGCQQRQRVDLRRRAIQRVSVAAALALVVLGAWHLADRQERRRALLEKVAQGEPEAAFAAIAWLAARGHDSEDLRQRLAERDQPYDVFVHGLGGVAAGSRAESVVRAVEIGLALLEASPEDPVGVGSLVWALDFGVLEDEAALRRAAALREEILQPLRSRAPPPEPRPGDPDWVDIPASTFWMGAGPEEGRDTPQMADEHPRHRVTLSTFRILAHEVTNAEYRRLFPGHGGSDDLPAASMTWFGAYTYAAWLGGRLPTEAEWELAARAGCDYQYCRQDGSQASLDEVAWWSGRFADPQAGGLEVQPVKLLEPNRWGLWDVFGNVWEWNATSFDPYSTLPRKDPPWADLGSLEYRTYRGGSVSVPAAWATPSGRGRDKPEFSDQYLGLRVVLPRLAGTGQGSRAVAPPPLETLP